jgi:hypothetical protein
MSYLETLQHHMAEAAGGPSALVPKASALASGPSAPSSYSQLLQEHLAFAHAADTKSVVPSHVSASVLAGSPAPLASPSSLARAAPQTESKLLSSGTRHGHRHVASKPRKMVDPELIATTLRAGCCAKRCLSLFTVEEIRLKREQFAERTEMERLDFLVGELSHALTTHRGYHCYTVQHTSALDHSQAVVCRVAFIAIYGTSTYKLGRAIELSREGHSAPIHGNVGVRSEITASSVESWFATFIEEWCDKISDDQWLLPSSLHWEDVFALFLKDVSLPTSGSSHCSYSEFCKIRKHKFRHLHCPRTGTLATCNVCDALRFDRSCARGDAHARELVHKAMVEHHRIFTRERIAMQEKMSRAQHHPDQLAMFFIDYTEAVRFPHFQRIPEVFVFAFSKVIHNRY